MNAAALAARPEGATAEDVTMSLNEILSSWLDGPIAAYRGWRRRRRAAAELNRLDDRMLSDIGISRSEIPSVVAGVGRGFRRRPANANTPAFGRRKAA